MTRALAQGQAGAGILLDGMEGGMADHDQAGAGHDLLDARPCTQVGRFKIIPTLNACLA